jgi:hypothetical protein
VSHAHTCSPSPRSLAHTHRNRDRRASAEKKLWDKPVTKGEAPAPRHFHNCVVHENKMYVFAGFDGSRWRNDVVALDMSTWTWEHLLVAGRAPGPRASGTMCVLGGKIVIFGGYDGEDFLDDMWVLHTRDPETGRAGVYSWEQISPPKPKRKEDKPVWPAARSGHAVETFDNLMFIFGGRFKQGRFNDMCVFNAANMTWTKLTPAGESFKARKTHAVARVGKRIFLLGGHDGSNWMGDMHVLDIDGIVRGQQPKLTVTVPPSTLLHNLSSMVEVDLNVALYGEWDETA